ncbi:MAG: magnesium transporter CorA family protein [Streptosporangiaceae bacterium]
MDGYIVGLDGSSAPVSRSAVETALSKDQLLWLDLRMPDDEAVETLRDVFKFHPVALEDVAEFGQRPKAERFGDVVYIVAYAATSMLGELIEVHAFYAENFLVTARRKGCDSLDEVRRRVELGGGLNVGPDRPLRGVMLHHILDSMIDSFFSPLSDIDDKIDELLEEIFAGPSKENLATMLRMQRWLVGIRKTVAPQRDVMAAILANVVELPGQTDSAVPYMRDLYDHVIRISDLIDSYRDLLSGAMDAYLSMVSNKLNEVMKQLTIIATVFLPLSFLTGFFGQNFSWLVGHLGGLPAFLLIGIGTEAVAVGGLYWLFRRRGFL